MKKLVIVESPNKIKSIEKYLGEEYKVMASVGHIVRLPNSGPYRFGASVENWEPDWKIDSKKLDIVNDLKKVVKKVDEVLIATDPDREGEAIAQNLVDFLKIKNMHKRIRFNEITEDAVKTAVSKPTEIDHDLVYAQTARRLLDRVIGYQLSSLMRKKIANRPMPPSAGRVQSIALKLVVEKEKEIQKFVPIKYSTIEAKINDEVFANYYNNESEHKEWVFKDDIEKITNDLKGSLKVTSVNISERNDAKLTPLKQAALYRRGDSSLGMSAASVQRAAQRLYEGYGEGGLISYPRTDSTRLSDTFVKKAKAYLNKEFGDKYVSDIIKGTAGAQDAHEAIRPTNPNLTPEKAKQMFKLESSEYKVYKLIYEHTMSALMNVPRREVIRYELEENKHTFRMTSSKVIFMGYFKLVGYEKSKELPNYKEGEIVKVEDYIVKDHETKPPARYNDGSLIDKLDSIKVGRPSTFATTVNILKQRAYVDMIGKALKPTDFGKTVYTKLIEATPKIMNEEYTANLESTLDQIADGKKDYKEVMTNFWDSFQKDVHTAEINLQKTKLIPIPAGKKCPLCGKELIVKRNKINGQKFFGCEGFPDCKHTENDPNQKRTFFRKWKK